MKEAVPRIFRSLQSSRGEARIDAVVSAAVAAFGSLRAPSAEQTRDFGRLVAPLWSRTSPATRRGLAASLSLVPRMPRDLVRLIVAAPVEISAPFLVSTPTLTLSDVETLAAQDDERLHRILKGREERGLLPAPASFEDEATPRNLPFLDAPPLAPSELGEAAEAPHGPAAETVRATLRRLALSGRAGPSESSDPAVGPAVLDLARGGRSPAFFDALETRLQLPVAERAAAEGDTSGRALAAILKSRRVPTGEALAILMLVCPSIGLDVAAFDAMAAHYRSLEASGAPAARRIASDRERIAPIADPRAAPRRGSLAG